MTLHEGMELELAVTRLAVGGRGVARSEGLVVFVEGGLPDSLVRARVSKVRKGFAEAQVVETLTPSPQAVPPACRHADVCGGCPWQTLDAAAQLFWKREHVLETLTRLGGLADVPVRPTVPSPNVLGYRNKMEFAFAGNLHLGLHERFRPGRVLDITECRLMAPWAAEVVAFVRDFCRATGLPAYDARTGRGVWRHLVLRESAATGKRLAHLITGPARTAGGAAHGLGEALLTRFPDLTGFVHSVRRAPSAVALGERQVSGLGETRLEERIGDVRLFVSPDAFLQTNTAAAGLLYRLVAEAAGQAADGTAWDLYCGSGGISLTLAPHFALVHGVEADARAIDDARDAAARNGIDNCVFHAQDAGRAMADLASTDPTVVVLDPPRAGAAPEVLTAILDAAPARVVYVSCDPATLARDLRRLAEDYEVTSVTPVDLFPQTAHIECVAALRRR